MVHNHTASVAAMARTLRMGLDTKKEDAVVKTASLVLLIDTLLQLAEPAHHAPVKDRAVSAFDNMMAPFRHAGTTNG